MEIGDPCAACRICRSGIGHGCHRRPTTDPAVAPLATRAHAHKLDRQRLRRSPAATAERHVTGVLIVVGALAALMLLAYRGWSILVLTPFLALAAVILIGEGQILASYTQIFMRAAGDFVVNLFPVFLLGALFGKVMAASGAAEALAARISALLGPERAILAVVLCCAVMTYGGISLFVVTFAVFPIAATLFRKAGINKRLIPSAIVLGAFTFTMTTLPGTPAVQNAIPMPVFGTTAFALPGLSLIASVVILGTGLWLLAWRQRAYGPGYGPYEDKSAATAGDPPSWTVGATALGLVLAGNLLFTFVILPAMDFSYLAEPEWGATSFEAVRGLWAIIASMTIATFALIAMTFSRINGRISSLFQEGAGEALVPMFTVASLVGFGAVIARQYAFGTINDAIVALGGDSTLLSAALSTALLAAVTASSSGGLAAAMSALGPTFYEAAVADGVSLELMHRVVAMTSGVAHFMPHNGAFISLVGVCGLTLKETYRDAFLFGLVTPLVGLVVVIVLGTTIGPF
jgi:H+/gluconate symporter-like permease